MTTEEATAQLQAARRHQRKTQEAANVAWTQYFVSRGDDLAARRAVLEAEAREQGETVRP